MNDKKVKTTIYLDKKTLKKVKIMVVNKEKTNVESVSHAVNWGLEEVVKRGKIQKKGSALVWHVREATPKAL